MSSNYAHKLQSFEALPPAGAWDRIAEVLDAGAAPQVADKLFFYEQAPPKGTWEKIEAALPAGEGKVISIFERLRRPIRYAGATAALVVIGLLTSLLLSKRTESGTTADANPVEKAGKASTAAPANTEAPEVNSGAQEPIASAATGNSRPLTVAYRPAGAGLATDRLSYLNTTDVTEGLREAVRSSMLFRRLFSVPGEPRSIPPMDGADRYMVYSDGNGHIARLPKKIYDEVRCKEEDLACQQRLRTLQQKIAASAFTTDFTGVMQILGNLQENN